ncbi:hypothetical protein SH661x_002612 [Planctomicrobium sp. SH661]|uniref:hypothetical protein n=1 Tax=Planctomicrobium sp. SH661 TaxID=3448124 RepID=UPI003F5AEBE1
MIPVHGIVFFEGKPLEQGDIKFVPEDPGRGDAAVGTIRYGQFQMITTVSSPGARVGRYQVTITSYDSNAESARKMPLPGEKVTLPTSLIPEKYGNPSTSGLIVEVVPGLKSLKYELDSMTFSGSHASR